MDSRAYGLIDFGNDKRLEQWGPYLLARPDPTAWSAPAKPELWAAADATYEGDKGKGEWVTKTAMPEKWVTTHGDVSMITKLAPYKHTGVFPEQRQNWDWMRAEAKKLGRPLNILNLFAYTGGATMALAKDAHFVTHVDSSRPAITWAKENAELNDIRPDGIRWMLEDAATFAAREVKRGKTYDGILLDPPAVGHGPTGKMWRIESDLAPLLEDCRTLLSETPAFLLVNGYAQHDTPDSFWRLVAGVLGARFGRGSFEVDADELMLEAADGRMLSTGIYARASFSGKN